MLSICSRCLIRCRTIYRNKLLISSTTRSFISSRLSGADDFPIHPVPDLEYLLAPENLEKIRSNIKNRKGVGDIDLLHKIFETYKANLDDAAIQEKLEKVALLIPNQSSPDTINGSELKIVKQYGEVRDSKSAAFEEICRKQGLINFQKLATSNLLFGGRSYFLIGDLAKLERALVRWTLDKLRDRGWNYISVPDLLPEKLINGCGFVTTGRQNQIYKVRADQGGLCLAGTSEMSMAGLYAGKSMENSQPVKMCTYSQCYRAEEAKNKIDKGFYRLHQFTKVEMFTVCMPSQSDGLLQEIVEIQCELFAELGLCYRLAQMPSEELGAAAYKKYDIEAWLEHLKHWGEISSASNCTDYQARRLAITTPDDEFAHTVNGTGCAIPRILMAIVEQNQTQNGQIMVPECLQPYINLRYLRPTKQMLPFNLRPIRSRKKFF